MDYVVKQLLDLPIQQQIADSLYDIANHCHAHQIHDRLFVEDLTSGHHMLATDSHRMLIVRNDSFNGVISGGVYIFVARPNYEAGDRRCIVQNLGRLKVVMDWKKCVFHEDVAIPGTIEYICHCNGAGPYSAELNGGCGRLRLNGVESFWIRPEYLPTIPGKWIGVAYNQPENKASKGCGDGFRYEFKMTSGDYTLTWIVMSLSKTEMVEPHNDSTVANPE